MHGLRHSVLSPGLPAREHHPGLERPRLPQSVARGDRSSARDEQLPGVDGPSLPGALRGRLRPGDQRRPGDDQGRRGRHHRARIRRGMGRCRAAARPHREERRGRRLGPGRPRRRRSAQPCRPSGDRLRARRSDRRAAALRDPRVQDGEALRRSPAVADGEERRAISYGRPRRCQRADRDPAPRLRRGGSGRRRLLAARSRDSRARARRSPIRDGVPDSPEPPLRGRSHSRRAVHQRSRQAGRHHRRRRYRRRLSGHGAPTRRRLRPPVRALAATARPARARQSVAPVAEHFSGVGRPRGGRRARLRGVHAAFRAAG